MKAVVIERSEPDRRYNPGEFDEVLPALPAEKPARTKKQRSRDEGPSADLDAILEGCSWLRHTRDDRASLPEPEWYAMLSIVGRCESADKDGRQLAHEWSERYPGYTREETNRKLDQALRASSPRTCKDIAEKLGAAKDHCSQCEHCGRIKSPIVLGGPKATSSRTRTVVVVANDEKRVNDQALAALEGHPGLFRRGGVLVHVLHDEGPKGAIIRPKGAPRIAAIQEATLREMLAEVIDFKKRTSPAQGKPKLHRVNPPQQCCRAILNRGQWRALRPLEGVTEVPVLRPGGSILQQPGYDEVTGLLYLPTAQYVEIPLRPTGRQLRTALRDLQQVVRDFPFRSETHRSAWLASLLTPIARHAFPGPSPCNLIDANIRGSGKGLLASVTGVISTGRDIARMPYSLNLEEQRKAILSIALEAIPVVLIDNVVGAFGSPILDAAFTAAEWNDRLLGLNRMVTAPLATVWYATGNNVIVVGDTTRRCLHIRLESPLENPEEREDLEEPKLLKWVREERGRLTAAALTLLRAYFVAGCPDQRLTPWGSFEGWSDLIRNCVVWLGLPDPGATRLELRRAAGSEAMTLGSLVLGLEEVCEGMPGRRATASEILETLRATDRSCHSRLREALTELVARPQAVDLPNAHQFSAVLRSVRGRVVQGRAIDHAQEPRTGGGVLWCVRRAGDGTKNAVDAVDAVAIPPAEINPASLAVAGGVNSPGGRTTAPIASTALASELEKWEY